MNILLMLLVPFISFAIDCKHPKLTKVEKLLCSDKELLQLDGKLNALYAQAKKNKKINQESLLKDQRGWLQLRDGEDACPDEEEVTKDCLKNLFEGRIGELSKNETFYSKKIVKSTADYDLVEMKEKYPGTHGSRIPLFKPHFKNAKKVNQEIEGQIDPCSYKDKQNDLSIEVIALKNEIASLQVDTTYDCGSPHPNYTSQNVLWDLGTGQKLELQEKDLINPEKTGLFKKIFDPTKCQGAIEDESCEMYVCESLKESKKSSYSLTYIIKSETSQVAPSVYFPHVSHYCSGEVFKSIKTQELQGHFKKDSPSWKILQKLL